MYKVGNFIYLYSNKNNQIFSAKVVEEITIKSLDGEKVDYTVNIKNTEESTFQISDLTSSGKYKVFQSKNQLRDHMISNANNFITKLISNCDENRIKYWGKTDEDILKEVANKNTEVIESSNDISKDRIQIELENGTKANIIDNTGVIS